MKGTSVYYLHQVLVSRELGGAGIMALRLASFLKKNAQESHVWIPGEGPALKQAAELGLARHVYDMNSIFGQRKLPAALGNWRMGWGLRRYRPGIVHLHSPAHYGALRLGIKLSGLKSVVHVQIETPHEELQWAFKEPPHLIVTCAEFLIADVRRALPEAYRAKQQIVCVPNTVDTEQFYPGDKPAAKRQVEAPADIPLLMMTANLAPHKGQETAIKAVARLKQDGMHTHLWLVGSERGGAYSYQVHLQQLCQELRVQDRVRFLGQRSDIPQLLRAADCLLLPSTQEGLPLSVLEAQAMKVPVLASLAPGIMEVVTHEKTGFLIPAHDDVGYAQAIAQLLGDQNIRQQVTEQAYANTVQKYAADVQCQHVLELYQSLRAF